MQIINDLAKRNNITQKQMSQLLGITQNNIV